MVEVTAPTSKVPKKTTPKKTAPRVDDGEVTEASGRGDESLDQCVLSGNAGKKIKPTLPLTTCYTNTRPEYAKFFVSLGAGKQRELCVLSKCLDYRNMIASQVSVKSFPKWIPRQFLQVSSQVLLQRIAIVIKDAQPEVPIFQGKQNVKHQPMSGIPPHRTSHGPTLYSFYKNG